MRNFKKILLRILLIFAFLCIVNKGGRFLYDTPENMAGYAIRDIKENKGEVDTLLLGTSLMHWGVNGQTLEEKIGGTVYNLATSAQSIRSSYYLLKDQTDINPIKRVFMGIHAISLINDTDGYIAIREGIYDRIQSPLNKLSYMLETAEPREYEQYLFFPTRVKDVLDVERVKDTVKYKLGEEYKKNESPKDEELIYQGMGDENTSVEYDGSFDDERLGDDAIWNRDNIIPENVYYLEKLSALCQEKNIQLNFVVVPPTWEFTKLMGDLEDFHQYLLGYCEEYGADLYDFNEYEGIYDYLTDDCYQDKKHLNTKGAKVLAGLLGDWYLKEQ